MAGPYDAKIAALQDAAASGELRIESDGEMIIYRSTDQLLKSLAYFQRLNDAAAAVPGVAPANVTVAAFDRD